MKDKQRIKDFEEGKEFGRIEREEEVLELIDEWMPNERIKKFKNDKGYTKDFFSMSNVNYALRLAKKELKERITEGERT